MDESKNRTLRSAGIGFVVGAVLSFVPLVNMAAPVLGGGVAGYLQRDGVKGGAIAGAIAGVLLVVFGWLSTAVIVFTRFGDLPFEGLSLAAVAVVAVMTVVGAVTQVVATVVGGGLGGILEEERARVAETATPRSRRRSLLAAVGALVAGFVTFAAVGLAVTAALDPYIWPSALVGLPVGFLVGSVVAVLGYRLLARTRGGDRRGPELHHEVP